MCVPTQSDRTDDRFLEGQFEAVANLGIFVLPVPAEL